MSNEMISLLEGTFKESVAAVINSKSIVLLHKCLSSNNKIENYTERLNQVSEKIYNKVGIKVKISTGKIYDKLDNMYKSFDIARDTLLFGKKIYPNENIYNFDSLKCEMLFSQKNENWKINELEETYQLLTLNDKSGVLRETLKVLIDEDGELNNVSSRLFIHRNTLSYRLNKIYKLTNRNPRSYTELFWLYSAIINFQ